MPKHIKTEDILNTVHGKITITEDLGTIDHVRFVMIKCECGVVKKMRLASIRTGKSESCGCGSLEALKKSLFKHGLTKHKLYVLWNSVKWRCANKTNTDYYQKGVRMCKEWRENFMPFYNWAIANGWEPGLELDKDIKHKEKFGTFPGKLYSPEFCSFVTPKVNVNSRKVTLFFEYNGVTKCFSEWCEIYGLNRKLSHQRLFRDKWSFEDLIKNKGDNTVTA